MQITALFLIACAAGVCAYSFYVRSAAPALPVSGISLTGYDWASLIKKEGGVAAYADLSRRLAGLDSSTQHGVAHAFGAALFKVEGVTSLPVCDNNFNYGCAHQFIGVSIQTLGISEVQELSNDCQKSPQPIPCQHGIGHGLVAYLGYSKPELDKAIELCNRYMTTTSVQGCIGGVFMEYNMRTMLGVTTQPRQGEAGDIIPLCDFYNGIAARSCAYYAAQWWMALMPNTDPLKAFVRLDGLCKSMKEEYQQSCVEGIGVMAPRTENFDAEKTAQLCDSALTKAHAITCRAYAAAVYSGTDLPQKAQEVCAGTEGAAKLYCVSYATGAASIDNELTFPLI